MLGANGVTMNKYQVTEAVSIHDGLLELTEAQAKPRMHNLKHIEDSVYMVMQPVMFKAGEVIGYDGELPKAMLMQLENLDAPKPKAKAKAKAKAQDKEQNAAENIMEQAQVTVQGDSDK